MLEIKALEVERTTDLSDLATYLRQSGLPHRISESGDIQVIWVASDEAADAVRNVYQHFLQGASPTAAAHESVSKKTSLVKTVLAVVLASPMTVTLMLATIICFPVTYQLLQQGQTGQWLGMFTLVEFVQTTNQLHFGDLNHTFESGQWWRLVTPMFIHFGWLHITFNLLWFWEIGHRVERHLGGVLLLALTLTASVAANVLQYYMFGVGLVGGMSGVVFGLLGFALVLSKLPPVLDLGVRPGIFIFMLVYLAVGFSGAVDLLGLGDIANGAHLGGLLGGLVLAFLVQLMRRSGLGK